MFLLKNRRTWIPRCLLGAMCAVFLAQGAGAQEDEWKSALLDKGRISVQYRISERAAESGGKALLIEDRATTVAAVSLSKLCGPDERPAQA